jgi:hypothetical protein
MYIIVIVGFVSVIAFILVIAWPSGVRSTAMEGVGGKGEGRGGKEKSSDAESNEVLHCEEKRVIQELD